MAKKKTTRAPRRQPTAHELPKERAEIAELKDENASRKLVHDGLLKELESVARKLEDAAHHNSNLEAQARVYETRIAELEAANSEIDREVHSVLTKNSEIEDQNRTLAAELAAMRIEEADLMRRVGEVSEALQVIKAAYEDTRNREAKLLEMLAKSRKVEVTGTNATVFIGPNTVTMSDLGSGS